MYREALTRMDRWGRRRGIKRFVSLLSFDLSALRLPTLPLHEALLGNRMTAR
jgi:hypothetical protein